MLMKEDKQKPKIKWNFNENDDEDDEEFTSSNPSLKKLVKL